MEESEVLKIKDDDDDDDIGNTKLYYTSTAQNYSIIILLCTNLGTNLITIGIYCQLCFHGHNAGRINLLHAHPKKTTLGHLLLNAKVPIYGMIFIC